MTDLSTIERIAALESALRQQEGLTQQWAEQAAANAIEAGRWRAVASNLAQVSAENRAIYDRQVRITFATPSEEIL